MRIDVQLVNFPKSDLVRNLVTSRISSCVDKFAEGVTSVKAFFSKDGIEHHVKIAIVSSKVKTFVSASANDVAHSIDKAIGKLEASLRRIIARNKHRKLEFGSLLLSDSKETLLKSRFLKRRNKLPENFFDTHESKCASDYEDFDRNKIV